MDFEQKITQRIDELLASSQRPTDNGAEVVTSTLSLLIAAYGVSDPRVEDYKDIRSSYAKGRMDERRTSNHTLPFAIAALRSLKSDIQLGFVRSIGSRITGEVISDFTSMARAALDQGALHVAAVLACASLEDSLKRVGMSRGLNVGELHMPEVIGELVKAQVIVGPQAKIVRGFVPLRNKVMHAEFDKVESADVKAVLGFNEDFILKHL